MTPDEIAALHAELANETKQRIDVLEQDAGKHLLNFLLIAVGQGGLVLTAGTVKHETVPRLLAALLRQLAIGVWAGSDQAYVTEIPPGEPYACPFCGRTVSSIPAEGWLFHEGAQCDQFVAKMRTFGLAIRSGVAFGVGFAPADVKGPPP